MKKSDLLDGLSKEVTGLPLRGTFGDQLQGLTQNLPTETNWAGDDCRTEPAGTGSSSSSSSSPLWWLQWSEQPALVQTVLATSHKTDEQHQLGQMV